MLTHKWLHNKEADFIRNKKKKKIKNKGETAHQHGEVNIEDSDKMLSENHLENSNTTSTSEIKNHNEVVVDDSFHSVGNETLDSQNSVSNEINMINFEEYPKDANTSNASQSPPNKSNVEASDISISESRISVQSSISSITSKQHAHLTFVVNTALKRDATKCGAGSYGGPIARSLKKLTPISRNINFKKGVSFNHTSEGKLLTFVGPSSSLEDLRKRPILSTRLYPPLKSFDEFPNKQSSTVILPPLQSTDNKIHSEIKKKMDLCIKMMDTSDHINPDGSDIDMDMSSIGNECSATADTTSLKSARSNDLTSLSSMRSNKSIFINVTQDSIWLCTIKKLTKASRKINSSLLIELSHLKTHAIVDQVFDYLHYVICGKELRQVTVAVPNAAESGTAKDMLLGESKTLLRFIKGVRNHSSVIY